MNPDPGRWSERSQVSLMLAVLVLWLAACLVGFDRGGPVLRGFVAAGLGIFGTLYWRYEALPWRDAASWTIPLTVWMAIVMIARPSPVFGVLAFAVGGGWLGLFSCWTPVVPWWYRWVSRKPYPFAR
jgi:hypothetical protein